MNESGRAVVHDEDPVFDEKPLHQNVKAAGVELAIVHQFQMLRAQFDVLRKRLVHRIGIDAVDCRAAMAEVSGEDAGDQAFSDASLSLQREMNRGCTGPSARSDSLQCFEVLPVKVRNIPAHSFSLLCPSYTKEMAEALRDGES
jgi:hypothetical protein